MFSRLQWVADMLRHFPRVSCPRHSISSGTDRFTGMYTQAKGSGFEAVNAFSLVASADEWFSRLCRGGPTETLIVDWYNSSFTT